MNSSIELDLASVPRLLAGDRLPRNPIHSEDALRALGLEFDTQFYWLNGRYDRLSRPQLLGLLSSQAHSLWPDIGVFAQLESTNTALLKLGAAAQGKVFTAEYQWGGHGRHGRNWISPIARSIAVSCTWVSRRPFVELGGLSLMVGLAVADGLRSMGVAEVQLKWPNDVLLPKQEGGFGKLAGVLIELQALDVGSLAIIGIGVNFDCAEITHGRIDQELADIAGLSLDLGRTAVLAGLLNVLADYLNQFDRNGFEPMVSGWESVHAFQGQEVRLIQAGVMGREDAEVLGCIEGVEPTGELRLRTTDGIRLFNAGEVSMRPWQ